MFRGKKWLKTKKTQEQINRMRSERSKSGWKSRKLMAAARAKK